jgi:hypothetical protein
MGAGRHLEPARFEALLKHWSNTGQVEATPPTRSDSKQQPNSADSERDRGTRAVDWTLKRLLRVGLQPLRCLAHSVEAWATCPQLLAPLLAQRAPPRQRRGGSFNQQPKARTLAPRFGAGVEARPSAWPMACTLVLGLGPWRGSTALGLGHGVEARPWAWPMACTRVLSFGQGSSSSTERVPVQPTRRGSWPAPASTPFALASMHVARARYCVHVHIVHVQQIRRLGGGGGLACEHALRLGPRRGSRPYDSWNQSPWQGCRRNRHLGGSAPAASSRTHPCC